MTARRYRHLPGTEGAKLVKTPLVKKVVDGLSSLADRDGLVLVHAPPGVGKTFAVDAAAYAMGRTVHWLDVTGETSMTATYRRLWKVITGQFPTTRNQTLGAEIVEVLSEQDCILVIDEAQWADRRLLRTARSIYDRVGGARDREGRRFGLVLVGQHVDAVVQRGEPGLWSRVSRDIKAAPLHHKTLHRVLGQYHELYANTEGQVIHDLYRSASGNWREWAHILEIALYQGVRPADGIAASEARVILMARGRGLPT